MASSVMSSLDLDGRAAHSVALLEDTVPSCWLAVDTDQVTGRLGRGNLLFKELPDSSPFVDVQVVGEAATIVVDYQNSHTCPFKGL